MRIRYDHSFKIPFEFTALLFVEDPAIGTIDTPHGRVTFLQLFGITTAEANSVESGETTAAEVIEKHRANDPLLVTELDVPEIGAAAPVAEDSTPNSPQPTNSAYDISRRVSDN